MTIRLSTGGKLLAFAGRMRLAEGMRIERWEPGDTATLAIEEVRRVQHLRKIAPGLIASLRETAARAAGGYSLVTWTGPVPDECLGQVAVWDADRISERAGVLPQAGYLRGYRHCELAVAGVR